MSLVGKKFKINPELEIYDEVSDNILFYIQQSKLENHYVVSWIESDGEEVEECFANYTKESVEYFIENKDWLLENE